MNARLATLICTLAALWQVAVCAAADFPSPPLLLADDTRNPRIVVSWPTRDGERVHLEGSRPYRSPGDERLLGRNIKVYAALGGTRLDWGLGHPDGATIRLGLYKHRTRRPFFDNIADGAEITIIIDQIYMNQAVIPRPETGLMHIQYMLSDLVSCGLDEDSIDLYNTADAGDPLLEQLASENTRPGVLAGGGTGRGTITTAVAEDGAVSITWRFPYSLLRHIRDPYQRGTPGGFFEPQHFHLELELLSAASAAAAAGPAQADAPDADPESPEGP